MEGLWISHLDYLVITLTLLLTGVPFRAAKVRKPPKKKAKLDLEPEGDGKCFWPEVADELILMITEYLDTKSLLCLGQTSSYFRILTNKDELWSRFYESARKGTQKIKGQYGCKGISTSQPELVDHFPKKYLYYLEKTLQKYRGFSRFTNSVGGEDQVNVGDLAVAGEGKDEMEGEITEEVENNKESEDEDEDDECMDCVLNCIRSLAPRGIGVFRLRSKGFFIAPNDSGLKTRSVPGPYEKNPDDESWIVHGVEDEKHLPSLTSQEADTIRRFAIERLQISQDNLKWAVAMGIGSYIWSGKKRKLNLLG